MVTRHKHRITRLEFDLRSLEVYLAVCDSGSMTMAARLLGMTQPGVSQTIRQLEIALGSVLIDRKLRPLGLTPAGTMLRQRGHELLTDARQILPAVHQSREAKVPLIRVGLVDSFTTIFGPPLARELHQLAFQLSIWSGLSDAHANALLNRQLDLIVSTAALEEADSFERFPLLREPFMLAAPKEWAARADVRPTFAQLSAELPLVRYTARSHIGMHIERHLRRLNIEPPRTLEFDSSDGVLALVGAGLGWAITTPLCVLSARLPPDRLALMPLPAPGTVRQLVLVGRTGELGSLPGKVAELARQILREQLSAELDKIMPWALEQIRIG